MVSARKPYFRTHKTNPDESPDFHALGLTRQFVCCAIDNGKQCGRTESIVRSMNRKSFSVTNCAIATMDSLWKQVLVSSKIKVYPLSSQGFRVRDPRVF